MPEFQGMTPEEEADIIKALDLRIGKTTSEAKTRVGRAAAARGSYRGGQLPKLEAEIEGAGVQARTQGLADLALLKAKERSDQTRYRYDLLNNRYLMDLEGYYDTQAAGGEGLANILATLALEGRGGGTGRGVGKRYKLARAV